MDARKMELVKSRIGFFGCLIVRAMGRRGGLAMLWRSKEYAEV